MEEVYFKPKVSVGKLQSKWKGKGKNEGKKAKKTACRAVGSDLELQPAPECSCRKLSADDRVASFKPKKNKRWFKKFGAHSVEYASDVSTSPQLSSSEQHAKGGKTKQSKLRSKWSLKGKGQYKRDLAELTERRHSFIIGSPSQQQQRSDDAHAGHHARRSGPHAGRSGAHAGAHAGRSGAHAGRSGAHAGASLEQLLARGSWDGSSY